MKNLADLVDRFLTWPLPASVCSDGCVTNRDYPHGRCGTNLLTADEARQMLQHVLDGGKLVLRPPAEDAVVSKITLSPISVADARRLFEKNSAYRGEFNIAIAAADESASVHGVIALNADGETFALGHIWTDGNAQVGSLLYGGAWRTAKAMGYKTIAI